MATRLTSGNSQPSGSAGAIRVLAEHFNPLVDEVNGLTAIAPSYVPTVSTAALKTSKEYIAEIPITTAQFKTAFTAALTLIAAPGAGKFIEVMGVTIKMTYGTAQYTSGGPLTIVSNTTAVITAIAAATVNAWAANTAYVAPVVVHAPVIGTTGAIKLSVATGNFATGDSNFVIVINYRIHTM